MKNLSILFLVCLSHLACKNNSESQSLSDRPFQQTAPFSKENVSYMDQLAFAKDPATLDSFYLTGMDVGKIQMVGIGHNERYEESGVSKASELGYNYFWDGYFDVTQKNPNSIVLALEVGTTGLPNNVHLGDTLALLRPRTFLNQHLFDLGIRKIKLCDPRIKTQEMITQYEKAGNLFAQRGGEIYIDTLTNSGFPILTITKFPTFNDEDIAYLRTKWYEECYKQDRQFEEIIWNACQKGAIAVAGAAHILRLVKIHHAKAAFALSEKDLNDCAIHLERERYYLYIIGKPEI
jgi:hypothetical protein